jgi:hypothetical protein
MDPFLESPDLWPAFHHEMMAALSDILKLGERYQVRIAERRYPSDLPDGGEQREEYIEIHQANTGNLVTLVDLVSPANKTTDAGRRAYLHTRQQANEAKANLVEIDLVLQGQPTLDYSRKDLPVWDYAVTVTRTTYPGRYEIYTATWEKRLPRFRVPLASDDRDGVVDLQVAFTKAFQQGGFAGKIHYRPEAIAGLKEAHRRELAERLGWPIPLAEAAWTHEDIQLAAYYIWKEQGCPEGRAEEHWRLAIEHLQQRRRV